MGILYKVKDGVLYCSELLPSPLLVMLCNQHCKVCTLKEMECNDNVVNFYSTWTPFVCIT